jgi:type I restriction enzyme, S subunit
LSADRLLEQYDRIADAPDAISRLRRFVLDLAVRGKLVPQDSQDGSALELLKLIAIEKTRLSKDGENRSRDIEALANEPPFESPANWAWTRIGDICSKTGSGSTPRGGKTAYHSAGVIFLRSQNIYDDGLRLDDVAYIDQQTHARMNGTVVRPNDLLLNITGGSIGRCCLVPASFSEANISQHVAIIRVAFDGLQAFLHLLILSPYFQSFIFAEQTGAGRGGLPKNRMDKIPVALPPLGEQQRIVAKVNDLMALCDQLESARSNREMLRDRLATASLARLDAPDPDPAIFADHVQFALGSLQAITTRSDQIKQLRQTILNLAVRGKLAPQDPNDRPAANYDRAVAPALEPPFDIPGSWNWARLHTLGRLKGGGTPPKAREDFWSGDIPWVSPKDMKVDYLAGAQMSITNAAIASSPVNLIETRSVLFVVRGMILAHSFPVAVTCIPVTINQDMKALELKNPSMAEFILLALKGLKPQMLLKVQRSTHGTCRLEGSDYRDFLIPIPPDAEQNRIVAKAKEMIALCDGLEASLTAGENTSRQLLDALMVEALGTPYREAA